MREGLPEITTDAEIWACEKCQEYGHDHPTIALGAMKLVHRVVHLSTFDHKVRKKR